MGIITVDGNIGCGKTGVLNHLHKVLKLPVDLEPVDNWQPYLNNMYIEKNNIFNFQVRIWLDRCWIQSINTNNILVERSPFFIKYTFIEIAKENKLITEAEYNILLDLHKKTDLMWMDNIYIYLRSNPESCLARIKKRNRTSEENIDIEYIKRLHELHESNILKLSKIISPKNLFIIDVENKTISSIATELYELIK
jgi:deoxyadenosine/deoxycytidine kinase